MIYNILENIVFKNIIIDINEYEYCFEKCYIDIKKSLIIFNTKNFFVEFDYVFFQNYLKTIINAKLDLPTNIDEYIEIINNHLTYLSLTNNPLSINSLIEKLGYLLINSEFKSDNSTYNVFQQLININNDNKNNDINTCEFLFPIIYNLKSFNKKEDSLIIKYDDINEFEYNILDYIFDYNID